MKHFQNIKKYGVLLGIAVVVILGAAYAQATGTWQNAQCAPPGCNADVPVNLGLNEQKKLGALQLNTDISNPWETGLIVFGKTVLKGDVQIASGSPGIGKVLVSDANGNASWGTASGNPDIVVVTTHASNFNEVASSTCPSGYIITGGGAGAYQTNGSCSDNSGAELLYSGPKYLPNGTYSKTVWTVQYSPCVRPAAVAICAKF